MWLKKRMAPQILMAVYKFKWLAKYLWNHDIHLIIFVYSRQNSTCPMLSAAAAVSVPAFTPKV